MKCKLKLFHCTWNTTCRAVFRPVEGRRKSGCLRWSLVASNLRVASTLLLASDLVLHNLFQNHVLSVNALCLCSAVSVLSWPEKMRGWTAAVAFSCFHPFGGGEKLLLKSRREWCLCRDTSSLTQGTRGWRSVHMTVHWSLHLAVTTIWSSPKPLDKSSSQGMQPPRNDMVSGSTVRLVRSWIKSVVFWHHENCVMVV